MKKIFTSYTSLTKYFIDIKKLVIHSMQRSDSIQAEPGGHGDRTFCRLFEPCKPFQTFKISYTYWWKAGEDWWRFDIFIIIMSQCFGLTSNCKILKTCQILFTDRLHVWIFTQFIVSCTRKEKRLAGSELLTCLWLVLNHIDRMLGSLSAQTVFGK